MLHLSLLDILSRMLYWRNSSKMHYFCNKIQKSPSARAGSQTPIIYFMTRKCVKPLFPNISGYCIRSEIFSLSEDHILF